MGNITAIFTYSGTGNSLWAARKLAQSLGETELIPMATVNNGIVHTEADVIGFVFPVHMWGLPLRVIDFISRIEIEPGKYYFALAVNAGQVAATLLQMKKLMESRGLCLAAGFSLCMPSNYIPWGGAPSEDKQRQLFRDAEEKIGCIADSIRARERKKPEQGPSWQNIFLSALYRMASPRIPEMDKSFWSDDRCTACSICKMICPTGNIAMNSGKPEWQHHCEQCLACIQWCPEEAIQFGKQTTKRKRYRHPEIKLKDMLACVPQKE